MEAKADAEKRKTRRGDRSKTPLGRLVIYRTVKSREGYVEHQAKVAQPWDDGTGEGAGAWADAEAKFPGACTGTVTTLAKPMPGLIWDTMW
jgi:hypothetical protein